MSVAYVPHHCPQPKASAGSALDVNLTRWFLPLSKADHTWLVGVVITEDDLLRTRGGVNVNQRCFSVKALREALTSESEWP